MALDAPTPDPSSPAANIAASISAPSLDRTGDENAHDETEITRLVARSRSGDRDAFGIIYETYYRRIYRLASFSLRDGAEDAVAETFVRAWAALPRYRRRGVPFVAWLYGIARHVVADELRARRRTEPRSEVPAEAHEPDHDRRLALADALGRIPQEQRRVIEMKYLIGLSNSEVAAALGKSIGAVNAQQWRALRNLEKLLEQR